jgi:hypothetical protein
VEPLEFEFGFVPIASPVLVVSDDPQPSSRVTTSITALR